MTAPDSSNDKLAAALSQISSDAGQISALCTPEAARFANLVATSLRALASQIDALIAQANDNSTTLTRHAAILNSLDGLDAQVASLATHLTDLAQQRNTSTGRYQPIPPPTWWNLTGPEREAALDRLRAWVEHIYRPSYGRLAATLPPCWERHPACVYTLDWLSELWSALYLTTHRDTRTLAAQAEWHTRLLPAAADHMATEATTCRH